MDAVNTVVNKKLKLNDTDRSKGSIPAQIKSAASRQAIELPDGWKVSVALYMVSGLAASKIVLPEQVLDSASSLFTAIRNRFETT